MIAAKKLLYYVLLISGAQLTQLHSATLTWDADSAAAGSQDGSGVWDTTTNTWWNGAANVVWNNAAGDSAVFGSANGGAGIVTNLAPITVAGLTFNSASGGSYTLGGTAANPVTLAGSPTITANASAALNVLLTGASFTKEGSGQLTLRPPANNTCAGATAVNAGTLVLNSSTSSRVLIPGDLVINAGATVTNAGAAGPVADTATVAVNAGGTYVPGNDAVGTLILDGGQLLQNGTEGLVVTSLDARSGDILQSPGAIGKLDGNLTKSTSGTVLITSRGTSTSAGLTTTVLNAGALVLDYTQTSSKLADSGSLTINGGVLVLTNFTANETVGTLILAGGVITNASGTADLRLNTGGSFDVRSGAVYANLGGGSGRTLTKTTSGTVILAADNGYSSGTLISGGVLQLGDGGATGTAGSTSAAITNNATLVFNRSGALVNFSGTISGTGSVVKMGSGYIGLTDANNSYSGTTTISNGVVNISSTSKLGDGTGALILAGGTLNTTASRTVSTAPILNPIVVNADSAITTTNPASTVDLNLASDSLSGNAGTLTFRNDAASGTGAFVPRFTGGGFDFSRPIVIANGSFGTTRLDSFNLLGTTQVFSGGISGNAGYRRNAAAVGTGGTTIFNGTNTYTGPTDVNRGALIVNGTLGTNVVTVSPTGLLGGNGTVNGPVVIQSGGTLSPGTSVGVMTVSNSLVFQITGTNFMELNKALGTNDLVRGLTSVTYNGVLVVNNLAGSLAANDTFKLFDSVSYSGAFNTFILPPLASGLSWDTTGLTNNGTIKIAGAAVAAPQINAVTVTGPILVFSGSGGLAGTDYHVLTSTNAAAPMSAWKAMATNQFAAGGAFSVTNGLDPAKPVLFYRVRVP
ncbi:MAG: autotransporter-associated beta strand repeat-containing protein [Verrucomicrobiota bacterium]